MDNVIVRMLGQEEFYLLEDFCREEEIPIPRSDFAKVAVAIDTGLEKVVGVVVTQMQVHTEPIWLKKEYQGRGIVEEMTEAMEGYLDFLAYSHGATIAAYNQPTNAAAERICRKKGYSKSDKPLYIKTYTGEKFAKANKEE